MSADVVLHGPHTALDRVAFVSLPGATTVRVRFRFDDGGRPWRCDACGRGRLPFCVHAQNVADALIRDLLHHSRTREDYPT